MQNPIKQKLTSPKDISPVAERRLRRSVTKSVNIRVCVASSEFYNNDELFREISLVVAAGFANDINGVWKW